jgi:kinesin family member 1
MFTHANQLEEVGIVSLTGVNVESDPQKESLLGVSYNLFFNGYSNNHLRDSFHLLFSHHRTLMH